MKAALALLVFSLPLAAQRPDRQLEAAPLPECGYNLAEGTACSWSPWNIVFPGCVDAKAIPPCAPETRPGAPCTWPQPFNTVGHVATYGTLIERDDEGRPVRPVAVVFGRYYDERFWTYGWALGAYSNCVGEGVTITSSLSSFNAFVPMFTYRASGTLWNGCVQP